MKENIQKYLRDFRDVNNSLTKVMDKAINKGDKILSSLYLNWQDIMGEKLTKEISINKISYYRDNATLHINCNSSFALEISYIEAIILEKIAVFFGYRAIHKIKIIQKNARL